MQPSKNDLYSKDLNGLELDVDVLIRLLENAVGTCYRANDYSSWIRAYEELVKARDNLKRKIYSV